MVLFLVSSDSVLKIGTSLHLLQLKTSLDPTLFKVPHLPHVLDVYSSVHISNAQFLSSHFDCSRC